MSEHMETEAKTNKYDLELLDLAIAGCENFELNNDNVRVFVQCNSYLIESLARSIVETTGDSIVDQEQAMSVFSSAQMIKFLAGLNAHLNDSAVLEQKTRKTQ